MRLWLGRRRRPRAKRCLWRCRACGTLNDFDGIEREINRTMEDGHFAQLAVYECIGCKLSVEPDPMWFVTKPDDAPVFIESAFQRVECPA